MGRLDKKVVEKTQRGEEGGGVTLICHQPDNYDLFKGHELLFPGGGGLMN